MSTMEVATFDTPETSLVRLALEKGVDVEVLERLVALQERGQARDARAAFFTAVSRFQDQCPEIRKSRTAKILTKSGAGYNYSYAPLEEITRTIRPALRDNGLSYSWDVQAADKVLTVICVLRHIEGHEERATFPVPVDTAAAMSDAQKNGAALTYGRRQSLVAALGLTTADDDNDAPDTRKPSKALTANQLDTLDSLMTEVKIDRARFLKWLGVENLTDLTQDDYGRAVKALEARR